MFNLLKFSKLKSSSWWPLDGSQTEAILVDLKKWNMRRERGKNTEQPDWESPYDQLDKTKGNKH